MDEKQLQESLMDEISKRNGCKLQCDISFKKVWIHDENYETEFRYVIFLNKLIVSRICFKNRHSWCMTACFEILKQFSDKLNYDIIEIQSVQTFEMMQWCRKMNFVPNQWNLDVIDSQNRKVFIGDYDFVIEKR